MHIFVTVYTKSLGNKYHLIVARKLLVADNEGHPVLEDVRVVVDLLEGGLLPLDVHVLELHPVQADGDCGGTELEEERCGKA